jgi:PDZ domain-containing protein
MRARWPGRLLVVGLLLLLVAAVLWAVPSDEYVYLPDKAQPVAPYVTVPNEHDGSRGGIYYVDVFVRKASLLERLLPWLRNGATYVPASAVEPEGASKEDLNRQSKLEMERSQPVAAAVALRELHYKVQIRPTGVLVTLVPRGGPAAGKLQPQDVIVSVNGRAIRRPQELRHAISEAGVGSTLSIAVRRGSTLRTFRMQPVADPGDPARRPVIGIFPEQAASIRLPITVRIDLGRVGGPSAGLAFALDVMEELGHNVDHGLRVAATGTIDLDGRVGPIGGVKQKVLGARRSGVDVFLVPAGDNAEEAARYAGGLKIVPVQSFRQALQALATLGRAAS